MGEARTTLKKRRQLNAGAPLSQPQFSQSFFDLRIQGLQYGSLVHGFCVSFVIRGYGSWFMATDSRFLRVQGSWFAATWTPKVCKIIAVRAIIMGFGLLFYILLGCR